MNCVTYKFYFKRVQPSGCTRSYISKPKFTYSHYNAKENINQNIKALEGKHRKHYLLWPEWILFAGLRWHFVKSFDDQL